MIELIIFDCDGVLVDSEWLASQVEVFEMEKLGYRLSLKDYLKLALGRTNPEVEKQLAETYNISLPENFWEKVQTIQREAFQEKLQPVLGVEKLIRKLPVPCCVASSSDALRLKHTLSITGLWHYFSGNVFGRECVKYGKPFPDIFLYASEKMHVPPSRCLVIEDSIHGIEAAKAAGMEVWAFCAGSHFSLPDVKNDLLNSEVKLFDDIETLWSAMQKITTKDLMIEAKST